MNKRLEAACYIKTGKLNANAAVEGGVYPFFTCAEYPDEIDHYAFDDNVVLVAGNNARGNFHVSRYKGKFNAYQRTYILTAKAGYSIDFIYYALKLELKRLREKAQGSQTKFLTMPILTSISLRNITYDEQCGIANKLIAIDKKIELNNQINAELEAMAKTLYDYWFVQFDFPDADGKPYKSSGGKMVYNKVLKREIPEGWELFSVSDLVDIKTGKEDANFAVEYGDYHFFTCGETNLRCNSYAFEGKAILLAGNGSFSVKKYKGKFNAYQRTYVLIPEDSLFGILYFTVKDRVNSFVAGSRGSIVKFITKGDIESIYISLPKNKILEFAKVLNTLLDKSSSLYEENIRLEELRDWLLPMLMNGQVAVK